MKTKQDRVLEIAKDMCVLTDSCKAGAENKCCTLNCEITWEAEKLVDKNYQKVGPDSVVLLKEDYEALLGKLQSLTYKYDKLLDDYRLCKDANETIKQNYIMVKQDTEQEVAKKFYSLSEECGRGAAYWRKSRALAKELGVEID